MEKKNLTFLLEELFKHLNKIEYDESDEFKKFKTEIIENIKKFLDAENYSRNTHTLNNTEIPKYQCTEKEISYLTRIKNEIVFIVNNIKEQKMNIEFDKLDIIISLSKFLDPDLYKGNIEVLKKLETAPNALVTPQKILTQKK